MPVDDATVEALVGLIPEGDWVDALVDGDSAARRRELLATLATPDFEIAMVGPGGFTGTFSGPGAFDDAWRDWLEPFASYRVERNPEIQRTDDAVVFFGRQIVTPKGSDNPMETDAATVAFFEDGKLRRIEFHLEPDSALRAAGLET